MTILKSIVSAGLMIGLTGCGLPQVNVKKEWTESISSFSFIPLYPMREDVFVGDIRVHRVDAHEGAALHSRPLARLNHGGAALGEHHRSGSEYPKTGEGPETTGETVRWAESTGGENIYAGQAKTNRLRQMSLPGVNVARVTKTGVNASGLLGLWRAVVGSTLDTEDTLFISLTGLETAELPDGDVATEFLDEVKALMRNERSLRGICVAAKSMGDPGFRATAISLVTRVAYARGAQYERKNERVFQGQVDAQQIAAAQATGSGNGDAGDADVNKGDVVTDNKATRQLQLNEVFARPLAFGVDAMMIDPVALYKDIVAEQERALREKPQSESQVSGPVKIAGLAAQCDVLAKDFVISPLSPRLTGARTIGVADRTRDTGQ